MKYKHWVTSEVLPSIRKNGGYVRGQESLSDEIITRALEVANNVIVKNKKKYLEQFSAMRYNYCWRY